MKWLLRALWTIGSVSAVYMLAYDRGYYLVSPIAELSDADSSTPDSGIPVLAPSTAPVILPPTLVHATPNRSLYVGYIYDLNSTYEGPNSGYLNGGCYSNSSTNLLVAYDDISQVAFNERTHIIAWDIVKADKVRGLIIAAIREDTDSDNRLSCDDSGSLFYFDLETQQPQLLQSGYDFSVSDLFNYENGFFSVGVVPARLYDGHTEFPVMSSSEFFGYDEKAKSMIMQSRLKFDPAFVTSVPIVITITPDNADDDSSN
ncbi:MAG: hypothetical protein MRY59_14360 [Aquisalinus sp.]|nr:hypothetical protein [Aquisalinus sp.]